MKTPRTLRCVEVHYDRFWAHSDPGHEELIYTHNGHTVRLIEGWEVKARFVDCVRCGRTHDARWDILLIDDQPVIIEEHHDDAEDWFPASQTFQLATGLYPYQFRAICEKLHQWGRDVYETRVEQRTFDLSSGVKPVWLPPQDREWLIDRAVYNNAHEQARRPFTRWRK